MDKIVRFEIKIGGFGGQGIVTIGRILGEAFTLYEGINSVNTQSYGPESRGGACKSEVIVSNGKINYPNVRKADVLVILSQEALDTYIMDLKERGKLLIDPKTVNNIPGRHKYNIYEVPMMEIAYDLGGAKYQNSVALGALCRLMEDIIKEPSGRKAITNNVPRSTLNENITAFEKGINYVKEG